MKKIYLSFLCAFLPLFSNARSKVEIAFVSVDANHKHAQVRITVDGKNYMTQAPVLMTYENSLVAKKDTAAVIDINQLPATVKKALKKYLKLTSRYFVVTKMGEKFTDVAFSTGSATGTPANLYWDTKNLIGTQFHREPKNNMPGASRRTDFCKGQCVRKLK